MARDAMVVEVASDSGRSFVMKPRMWVNQKSNQLVANPSIKSFLSTDLYLAPVEYQPAEGAPVSGRFLLRKSEPTAFRDWTLTFERFDLDAQHAVAGAMTVGVVVRLERPDQPPVALTPSVISTGDGIQAIPVDIPGQPGASIRATGMSVDQGLVRVELAGLGGGIGRTAVLARGESLAYEDLKITFTGFDLSELDPEAGALNYGVVFAVEQGGRVDQVVPWVHGHPGSEPVTSPAVVPGTGGISLSPGRLDPEAGTLQLQVFDPALPARQGAPASLVLDVSTKPLIGLVWLGTLMIIAGIVAAIGLRGRDIASIPVTES